MEWHLANSLNNLQDELDDSYPRRARPDGTIGNSAHRARRSDHNPNSRGSVNAIDIQNRGVDVDKVVARLIKHPSTSYVISRGHIWSRKYGFKKRKYTGSNPHNSHIHLSILQTRRAENSERSWLEAPAPEWPLALGHVFGPRYLMKISVPWRRRVHAGNESSKHAEIVRLWQKHLGVKQTGRYGRVTRYATKRLQGKLGLAKTGNLNLALARKRGIVKK